MRTVRAIIAVGFLCAMLLGTSADLAAAAVVSPQAGARLHFEPGVERIGCKLQGATLVCDGKILQNRLKRPRLKAKQKKVVAPSASKSKPAKSQAAKTPAAKTQSPKGVSSKSQTPKGVAPAPEQEQETITDDGQAASVSPGEEQTSEPKPPAPKEATVPAETPAAAAPSPPPAKTEAPDTPAPPPPDAKATSVAQGQACCTAQAVDRTSGLPLASDGKLTLCGATEEEAKTMLPTLAELKNYLVTGDIECAPK